jgi:poly-beta-1,6-N-acetyl-D-glucosamine synthase
MLEFVSLLFWLNFAILGWTYFGYPLFMYIWARFAPKGVDKDDNLLPSITLLIPAFNEEDVIRRKIENSLSLDYPTDKLQILVIDDGSDDTTASIVQEFRSQGVILITKMARSGKMSSVNMGFDQAVGEIVVLSDASPNYANDSLRLLVRSFANVNIGVVVGTLALWDVEQAVAKSAGLYWKFESALRSWESRTGSTVAVHGNMFAIRRSLYRPLNTSTINDEFSIAMEVIRQGYRVVYEPEAISYDDASSNMGEEFKRRVRINAGRYQALFSSGYLKMPTINMTFRLISHKLLRPLTPVFMLLLFVLNIFALVLSDGRGNLFQFVLSGWWALLLLSGQILFYFLALLGWYREKQSRPIRILNIPYYFVSMNLAALVGLWRWLSKTQSVTWQKRITGDPS